MSAALVYRERDYFTSRPRLPRTFSQEPRDYWYFILTETEDRLGYVHFASTPDIRDGTPGEQLFLVVRATLPVFGFSAKVLLTGNAWVSFDGKESSWDAVLRSAEQEFAIKGTVKDGRLEAVVQSGGQATPLSFALPEGALPWGGIFGEIPDIGDAAIGTVISVPAVDPITFKSTSARFTIEGKETMRVGSEAIPVTRLRLELQNMALGVLWVNEALEIVRLETPFGFVLMRSTAQEAMQQENDTQPAALFLQRHTVGWTGEKPSRGAKRMVCKLEGIGEAEVAQEGGMQKVNEGKLFIEVPEHPCVAPASSAGVSQEYLQGDVFITVGHPEIVATAKSIIGDTSDLWEKTARITEWLYNTLEKTAVVNVPTALEVLRTRQGDCNEHSVLFAALARSVGVPTRVAVGLVWSDELERFAFHAWPEVHCGEWVAVDPTLGQKQADATHIRLFTGSVETWGKVLLYLNRISVTVLSVE